MTTNTNNTHLWKPSATVAAVIERDGKFLIVEEPREHGIVFNQPAGHLEEGESLMNAVIREVREETAWKFTPEFIVGIYRWQSQALGKTHIRTTFCGSVSDHDPNQELFDGIIRADWKTLDELRHSNQLRSPLVLRCIADYQAGARHSLDLLHAIDSD